jgi:hypothetical protein
MNIHRLARPKKRKKKNCSRKQGGISQYHMATHFCKLLIWSGTSGCGATYVLAQHSNKSPSAKKTQLKTGVSSCDSGKRSHLECFSLYEIKYKYDIK